jgi:hypothetical protein
MKAIAIGGTRQQGWPCSVPSMISQQMISKFKALQSAHAGRSRKLAWTHKLAWTQARGCRRVGRRSTGRSTNVRSGSIASWRLSKAIQNGSNHPLNRNGIVSAHVQIEVDREDDDYHHDFAHAPQ